MTVLQFRAPRRDPALVTARLRDLQALLRGWAARQAGERRDHRRMEASVARLRTQTRQVARDLAAVRQALRRLGAVLPPGR